ncbi:FecR domain-containing protein [uncultured Chitinophaga sp.]|jgi:Fe2+-dicitrate sensor, membrane component|uniref:FecR family protein n=1 Tax=uncultured Chitinophaga sp. TaxID=339340 RepID=UPI002606E14A|nr:FecR domain-containing protein [uncultured Chitinophaga sp.]
MHPDQDYIRQLVIEEIAGTISEPDAAHLRQIIAESSAAWVLYTQLHQELDSFEVRAAREALAYNLTAAQILADSKKKRRKRQGIAIGSVAMLFLLGIGLYAYFLSDKPQPELVSSPGGQQFVQLQIGNEKTITLSEEKQQIALKGITLNNVERTLSYTADKAPAGVATLRVPPGKDYKIQLSDGTEVWLNSSSKLRFPFSFDEKTREITVSGEAWLKVAPDPQKPFIVHLPNSSHVEILGTSFNVNTYNEDRISVSLLEGAVKMQTQREAKILKPGQQTVYTPEKGLQLTTFDKEDVLAWQQGIYRFEDASLEEICQVIPRWYGIEVIIDNPQAAKQRFTGSFDRNQAVQASLERLKATELIDYDFDEEGVLHIH